MTLCHVSVTDRKTTAWIASHTPNSAYPRHYNSTHPHKVSLHLMFIGPCIIAIVDKWKTNFMSLAILFHLCAQHVSDINISIFRSLRLCWRITTSVVLFSVRCVKLQPAKRTPPNTSRNKSSNTQVFFCVLYLKFCSWNRATKLNPYTFFIPSAHIIYTIFILHAMD